MSNTGEDWPAGQTWVFQGTVAEDATAGTHVCSLTVTPGAGNEFQVLYGLIIGGATATAQLYSIFIDDGTNVISYIQNAFSSTNSGATIGVGDNTLSASANLTDELGLPSNPIVSGTMRLRMQVQTVAVSVTSTFAVACRIKGTVPTATLADPIGTPVLTTNTNRVF